MDFGIVIRLFVLLDEVDWTLYLSLTQVEYDVESFSSSGLTKDAYTDTKTVSLSLPTGGTVVYGVAHQHTGGIGSTLYGEVTFNVNFLFVIWPFNLIKLNRLSVKDSPYVPICLSI